MRRNFAKKIEADKKCLLAHIVFYEYAVTMDNEILIYMDCCCLNRPSDDQTQDKIRIETDAIMAVLYKCFYGNWKLIGSDIIEYEIMKTSDNNKKDKALNAYSIKKDTIAYPSQYNKFPLQRRYPAACGGVLPSGYGDYTKERHAWLDTLSIEEISSEIKTMKNIK